MSLNPVSSVKFCAVVLFRVLRRRLTLDTGLKNTLVSEISVVKRMIHYNHFQILEWISLLNDSYDMADNTLNYLDCQKRAVCELWR